MNTDSTVEWTSNSARTTQEWAARLGAACQGGEVLVLEGELGAGKTVFVRGLAEGLGCDPQEVRSPSYTLLNRYPGRLTLLHFDVYFTHHFEDLERSDLWGALDQGAVAVLEWGQRFAEQLPGDRLEIEILHRSPTERGLRIRALGSRSAAWLSRIGTN